MRDKAIFLGATCILFLVLQACATRSLGTAQFRDDPMQGGSFAISQGGLSKEQIEVILETRFPPDKPISLALFFLPRAYYSYGDVAYDPIPAIVRKLNNTTFVKRMVPVPSILVPSQISIDAVQQIGIRSLSEYSIVLYGDSRKIFFSYKSPFGHYMVSSMLEYMIIDNRTTAIIASDKLYSELQTPVEVFTDKEFQKTMDQMYEEQANELYDQLEVLFAKSRQ